MFTKWHESYAMSWLRGVSWLALAAVSGPALYSLNTETHRETVDIGAYPWSSIGKVSAAGQCTGVENVRSTARLIFLENHLDQPAEPVKHIKGGVDIPTSPDK